MLKDVTLGQFFPGKSLLHRLDPRIKIIATVLLILVVFLAKNLLGYGALILLTAAGLILNALNERSGSILTSWLLHMCANLAINTVGFYVFGML